MITVIRTITYIVKIMFFISLMVGVFCIHMNSEYTKVVPHTVELVKKLERNICNSDKSTCTTEFSAIFKDEQERSFKYNIDRAWFFGTEAPGTKHTMLLSERDIQRTGKGDAKMIAPIVIFTTIAILIL
jgi:hypothetical protein